MKIIPTNIPQGFQIDAEDYSLVRGRSFIMAGKGYVCLTVRKPERYPTYIHRLVMRAPSGLQVDHIKGDKLDNRKANLRLCSRSQNNMNSRSRRNGPKGVYLDKRRGLFAARIYVKGRFIFLGYFSDEKLAGSAYDVAAKEHFGDFSRLNYGSDIYG